MAHSVILMLCLLLTTTSGVPDWPATVGSKPGEHLGVSHDDPRVLNRLMSCPPTCPENCRDIQNLGNTRDGTYMVYIPSNHSLYTIVYCDLTTSGGGWLVFQRRMNGAVDFYRNWSDYENGFGSIGSEFWQGNYAMHLLSTNKYYRLRVDVKDLTDVAASTEFAYFSIGSPLAKYPLNINGVTPVTAGVGDGTLPASSAMKFTTYDQNNSPTAVNCASIIQNGGAWWYGADCGKANLNGVYTNLTTATCSTIVAWKTWKANPLKFVEMKFRPM